MQHNTWFKNKIKIRQLNKYSKTACLFRHILQKAAGYSSTPLPTTPSLCVGNYSEFDAELIILVEGEGGGRGVERGLEDR